MFGGWDAVATFSGKGGLLTKYRFGSLGGYWVYTFLMLIVNLNQNRKTFADS